MRLVLLLVVLLPQDGWQPDQKDVAIPMRDGKSLSADVYLPAKAGKYATVLIQTPYNKALLRGMMIEGKGRGGEVGRGAETDMAVIRDREHYAYVVADWRGFYASKGAADGAKKPIKRGLDGFDCVEWIAKQPWSDGKVGTWGGSALGRIQLDTAVEHPPHLVCAAPLIAPLGQRYEDYYEGGLLLEAHVQRLDQLGFGVGAVVKRFSDPESPAWKLAARETYKPEAIDVPCLFITGWWDNYPGSIVSSFEDVVSKGGEKARTGSKLMIGPWDHVSIGVAKQADLSFPGAEKASGEAAKAFFDRWLRGVDNGWDKVAPVRWWQIGDEKWLESDRWTAVKRKLELVDLGKGGTYAYDPQNPSPTLGGANLPPDKHGPTDHTALEGRKDQLVWRVASPLRVNGAVELSFEASTDRESCDFIARLCDVRDGKPYHLADAARRVKGSKSRVTLTFPPAAVTTRELRIYLSSSNWPRYEKMASAVTVTVSDGATLTVPTLP